MQTRKVTWFVSVFITMFTPSIGAVEKINISKKQAEKSEWTTTFYSAKITNGTLHELLQFESKITNNKMVTYTTLHIYKQSDEVLYFVTLETFHPLIFVKLQISILYPPMTASKFEKLI